MEVGTTVLLSVRVADRWFWEAREGKPVKSSGRPAVALGAVEAAVCPGAVAEATEVSPKRFARLFRDV